MLGNWWRRGNGVRTNGVQARLRKRRTQFSPVHAFRPLVERLEDRALLSADVAEPLAMLTPAVGAPDLVATSDTGVSNTDNLTKLDNSSSLQALQFVVGDTIAGATVTL